MTLLRTLVLSRNGQKCTRYGWLLVLAVIYAFCDIFGGLLKLMEVR